MREKNMMKALCFFLSLLFMIMPFGVFTVITAANINGTPIEDYEKIMTKTAPPEIAGNAAILMECKQGQMLYKKNQDIQLPIAIASKLMTVLLVTEKSDVKLNGNVTISKRAAEASNKALTLEAGSKYPVLDLLNSTMLTSANNAAIALAEHVSGNVDKFVELMNAKAEELDMKNTHFTNPTGLNDSAQYTTAYDIALLMKYALNFPAFKQTFSSTVTLITPEHGKSQMIKSQNELFWSYDGIDGGKIGYTDKNLQSIVATATRGNQQFLCIILDSPENSVFSDASNLLDYGFTNFRTSILVPKNYVHKTYDINGTKVSLTNTNDFEYTHPVGDSFIKDVMINAPETLQLPIVTTHIVGTAKYILNDDTVIEVSLSPDKAVVPPDNLYTRVYKKITENKDIFILVLILLSIEVILILYKIFKLIKKAVVKTAEEPEK